MVEKAAKLADEYARCRTQCGQRPVLSREIFHGNTFPTRIRKLHKLGMSDEVSSPTRVA